MQSTDTKTIDTALKSLATDEPISIRVSGTCMAPLIDDGAMIRVSPQRLYWPGDIVIFRRADDRLISHRLLGLYRRRNETRYMTKPDSVARPDSVITIDQVIGKVVGGECQANAVHIPYQQRIKSFIHFYRYMLVRAPSSIFGYNR